MSDGIQIYNCGIENAVVNAARKDPETTLKDIDNDVHIIKEFLREKVGTTHHEVTVTKAGDANYLELDLSDWGGDRNGAERRNGAPWMQMAREMATYRGHPPRRESMWGVYAHGMYGHHRDQGVRW